MPITTTIEITIRSGTQTVRLGGYIRDTAPRHEIELISHRSTTQLPEQVDLRAWCSAIENQGDLASCTANAAVGALEYLRGRGELTPIDYSRLFVYYNTRRLRGDLYTDSGATLSECMAALLAYGTPPEELWPYSDTQRWKDLPSSDIYQRAKLDLTLQFAQVSGEAAIRSALAASMPVCFGIFLPDGAYGSAAMTGLMGRSAEMNWASPTISGHAMLLVGYDLLRQHYIVRNSWGSGYGDRGYIYIPFDIMDRAAHPDSFWVVSESDQLGTLFAMPTATSTLDTQALRQSINAEVKNELSNVRSKLRSRLTKPDA